jgi:hypothetical protein
VLSGRISVVIHLAYTLLSYEYVRECWVQALQGLQAHLRVETFRGFCKLGCALEGLFSWGSVNSLAWGNLWQSCTGLRLLAGEEIRIV